MGRKYAGILGWLAFALTLARGLVSGRLEPGLLWQAVAAMFGLAAVGWLAGTLAESLVSESVRVRFAAAWQEQTAAADDSAEQAEQGNSLAA